MNSPIPMYLCRAIPLVRNEAVKKGMTREFEDYIRSCMATGCSARHNRDILLQSANYFLGVEEGPKFNAQVPKITWFSLQREAMGLTAYVYSFLQVAGCDEIVQWGFDETTLDGQSCFNQWCLIRRDGAVKLVTLECAGLLPSSTAEETIAHITDTWERGKTVVNMLRDQLGPDLQDVHCPLINGGVAIHKIFDLIHDTCNTANRVAELMSSLRDDCGKQFFGEETWNAAGNKVHYPQPFSSFDSSPSNLH
jgi:hypothetical protein